MRASLPLAATLLAAACLVPLEPADRLDLSISLSATQVHADTGVTIRLTATNRHWQTVHLRTTGGCVVAFRLIGPGAGDLPPDGWACHSILVEFDLAPGDSIVRSFPLRFQPTRADRRWPSGRYEVIGQLLGEHLDVVQEADPVGFDLVCRDPAWTEC